LLHTDNEDLFSSDSDFSVVYTHTSSQSPNTIISHAGKTCKGVHYSLKNHCIVSVNITVVSTPTSCSW